MMINKLVINFDECIGKRKRRKGKILRRNVILPVEKWQTIKFLQGDLFVTGNAKALQVFFKGQLIYDIVD